MTGWLGIRILYPSGVTCLSNYNTGNNALLRKWIEEMFDYFTPFFKWFVTPFRKDSMAECYQRASKRACVTFPLFGQGTTFFFLMVICNSLNLLLKSLPINIINCSVLTGAYDWNKNICLFVYMQIISHDTLR